MRIKYLRIRNIASIEKADIDFESGLQAPGVDSPAPLFLITGDTGSGKSVILDCISMALYGTTPRVKGVANRTNNSFLGSDGNEIKIHDISQYTRLGISSKDDCYSELTFEGNDGEIYISKFSLGIVRTGNFRPVGWRLQVGTDEVLEGNKKDEIKKRIVSAVGLTYEQFCRMAMLAQGQFADFLTGGKDERERILEQLTSTQQFSRYGEAIERIFKKAKQKKEHSERILASETAHLMNAEEENATAAKLNQLENEVNEIKKRKEKLEETLSIFTNISLREKECEEIEKELFKLNDIKAGEDFQSKIRVLQKWDSTSAERDNLRKKKDTMMSLNASLKDFNIHLSEFSILSKDFLRREDELEEKRKSLNIIKDALKQYEPCREIYENIPLIKEKFNYLEQLVFELSSKENELKKELSETESLSLLFSQADKESISASSKLKEKKELIAKLSANREALNPEGNEKALDNELKRQSLIENLTTLIDIAEEHDLDLAKGNKGKNELIRQLEEQRKLSITSENVLKSLRKQLEESQQRYATMHLSVEENFNNLRLRLADEDAHLCPLCGQPKEWHNSKEGLHHTFSKILSPLEEETNKLKEKCELAESNHLDFVKKSNQTAGMLETQEQAIRNLEAGLEKRRGEISNLLPMVGLSGDLLTNQPDHNDSNYEALRKSVSELSAKTAQNISTLSEIKQMADNIQAEINEELIKSHPLEEEDAAATKKRNEAHTNLLLNTHKIQNLEKNIEGLKPRIKVYEKEIDNLVLSHSPKWRENPSATLLVIEEEGKNFISISNNERLITEEINNAAKVLASLKEIGKDIEKILIGFQPSPASEGVKDNLTLKPESIDLESLPKFWHSLLGEISSEVRTIDKYRNDIQVINEILDEYYLESSSNETDLESLLQMELSIPAIRDYVNELNTKITSRNDSLKISREALSELNERLHNKFTDDNSGLILDKVNLEEEKASVSSKLEEHLKEMGIVKERLQQNEANKKRVAEVSANLDKDRERFNEWDRLNRHFGGTRFRTLVQSYILRPLLKNANIYLNRITDRFLLTCSEQNEQLSILVLDRYNKNKIRSATVLSGGERFMISLALSLALSAMNKPGLNIDILFIDEGFGTLDAGSLNAVIDTLRRLPEIAGSNRRRVGVISHREELADCIDVQIRVNKCGEGRSRVEITNKIVN